MSATKPKIYICGDIHGNWEALNNKTKKIFESDKIEKVDLIVTGDFGYWPKYEKISLSDIETYDKRLRIFFCPGNHEDWWSLLELEEKSTSEIIKVAPNIYYAPFGSTRNFNGKTFMFCGGADSIDKNSRKLGLDWFPEEVINERKMKMLPDKKIHVIISHTCPSSVFYAVKKYLPHPEYLSHDPSTKYLSMIFEEYNPKLWYFGHWHTYCAFRDCQTEFVCLDRIDSDKTSIVEFHYPSL